MVIKAATTHSVPTKNITKHFLCIYATGVTSKQGLELLFAHRMYPFHMGALEVFSPANTFSSYPVPVSGSSNSQYSLFEQYFVWVGNTSPAERQTLSAKLQLRKSW